MIDDPNPWLCLYGQTVIGVEIQRFGEKNIDCHTVVQNETASARQALVITTSCGAKMTLWATTTAKPGNKDGVKTITALIGAKEDEPENARCILTLT